MVVAAETLDGSETSTSSGSSRSEAKEKSGGWRPPLRTRSIFLFWRAEIMVWYYGSERATEERRRRRRRVACTMATFEVCRQRSRDSGDERAGVPRGPCNRNSEKGHLSLTNWSNARQTGPRSADRASGSLQPRPSVNQVSQCSSAAANSYQQGPGRMLSFLSQCSAGHSYRVRVQEAESQQRARRIAGLALSSSSTLISCRPSVGGWRVCG